MKQNKLWFRAKMFGWGEIGIGTQSQDLERFCNQKCERCTVPVRKVDTTK